MKAATTCTNATYTYTDFCNGGSCSYYHDAAYSDGTLPAFSKVGNKLAVNWPHAGTGVINIWVDVITGEQFILPINVTITDCLSFSSAPSLLCNGSSGTFSLSDSNGSTTFTWTAPSGWSINNGSNTLTTSLTSVGIKAPTSGVGSSNVTVTSNASGSETKTLWVGAPSAASYTPYTTGREGVNPVTLQLNKSYAFFADVSGATSYSWTIPSGFIWGTGSHTGSPVNIKTANYEGYFTLYCQATNSCGSSNLHSLNIITATGGGGPIERMAAPDHAALEETHDGGFDVPYPLPATQQININLSSPGTLRLVDIHGTSLRELNAEGLVVFPTDDFKAGIYILTLENHLGIKQFKISISK